MMIYRNNFFGGVFDRNQISPDHNIIEIEIVKKNKYERNSKNDPLVCKVKFSFRLFDIHNYKI